MSHVEGRRPFFRMGVEGILRSGLNIAPEPPVMNPPITALVSSSDFDQV